MKHVRKVSKSKGAKFAEWVRKLRSKVGEIKPFK